MDFTTHNEKISQLLPTFEAFQNEYIKTHSTYFRAANTHSVIPDQPAISDRLDVKLGSNIESWRYTAIIDSSEKIPMAVRFHEYTALDNSKGWQAVFYALGKKSAATAPTVMFDAVFTRSIGYGVEAETRTHDWE